MVSWVRPFFQSRDCSSQSRSFLQAPSHILSSYVKSQNLCRESLFLSFKTKAMAFHHLERKKILHVDLDTAWDYFSSPHNLREITPEYMQMQVKYQSGSQRTYPGQIITYTVKPLLGIPLNWMTEITHLKDKEYFVDEQRFGPYALWHHTHLFRAVDGGVEMTDIVNYKMPFGFIGEIAHFLFVRKQVSAIFDYRNQRLDDIFGGSK